MKINFKELNIVTKILLIILLIFVIYFIVFSLIRPFSTTQTPMVEMMSQMMGSNFVNFSNSGSIISLIISFAVAIIVSFYLFSKEPRKLITKVSKQDQYQILKKVLSQDEKTTLDEIQKAGEITQDSLRFRLNWSKAKVSTILTSLDRKGLIQRERTGKTYKVYLQKQFKTV